MPFTEPLLLLVVRLAQSAVASAPKRTSLPSMFGPPAASPLNARLGARSATMVLKVSTAHSRLMTPRIITPNFGLRRKLPSANTSATGIRMIEMHSRRLLRGVGFSSGTALLGPYQPPPLVPSCLMATSAATGPTGMVWVVMVCTFLSTVTVCD